MTEDIVLKKLKRNFVLHNLCNLGLGVMVMVGVVYNTQIGFPLIMLGASFIATGITCRCIAKRIEYLKR